MKSKIKRNKEKLEPHMRGYEIKDEILQAS